MVPRMSASSKATDLSLASDVSEPVIEGDDTVLTAPSPPFPPAFPPPAAPYTVMSSTWMRQFASVCIVYLAIKAVLMCANTQHKKQEDAAQLLQETDTFLESQAVTTSNGTPFKDVVRKNRLLIARCRSVLDKAVDESTRLQVLPPPSSVSPTFEPFLGRA